MPLKMLALVDREMPVDIYWVSEVDLLRVAQHRILVLYTAHLPESLDVE